MRGGSIGAIAVVDQAVTLAPRIQPPCRCPVRVQCGPMIKASGPTRGTLIEHPGPLALHAGVGSEPSPGKENHRAG